MSLLKYAWYISLNVYFNNEFVLKISLNRNIYLRKIIYVRVDRTCTNIWTGGPPVRTAVATVSLSCRDKYCKTFLTGKEGSTYNYIASLIPDLKYYKLGQ